MWEFLALDQNNSHPNIPTGDSATLLSSADAKKKALEEGKAAAKATLATIESQMEQKDPAKDSATPQTQKIAITASGNAKATGKGRDFADQNGPGLRLDKLQQGAELQNLDSCTG